MDDLLLAQQTTATATHHAMIQLRNVKKLNQDGTTIVQVTHNEAWAGYGRRILRLKDGGMET